jgi:hypothetical protein
MIHPAKARFDVEQATGNTRAQDGRNRSTATVTNQVFALRDMP